MVIGRRERYVAKRPNEERSAWRNLVPSHRTEILIPLIHLDHSVDAGLLRAADTKTPKSPVQLREASAHHNLGPEHHRSRLMVAAFSKAQAVP